jgi:hypothetical protein
MIAKPLLESLKGDPAILSSLEVVANHSQKALRVV